MEGQFSGKVALVTGAAAGIGRATAIAFARAGAKVVVADIEPNGGQETVDLIVNLGGTATFVKADVSAAVDVTRIVRTAVDRFGRLDFAFNNAGIEGQQAPIAECTEENWDRVMAVNLTSVFLCMKAEVPEMLKSGGGAIVNCSSVAGLVGFGGIPAYTASKHGIIGLTKNVALDYATAGIRVNAVCPGVIETAMIHRFTGGNADAHAAMTSMEPVGRLGKPEEIADAVIWLCSDASSFVTGIALPVDGAFVAR